MQLLNIKKSENHGFKFYCYFIDSKKIDQYLKNVWKLTPWVDGCAEKMKEYYLKQSLTSYNLLILATIAYVLILIISTINVVSVARLFLCYKII